jgi:type VI secretion system protein ImpA
MTSVRQAVRECLLLARQLLERKGPAPSEALEGEAAEGEAGEPGAPGGGSYVSRGVRSRAEVYQRLAEAADLLQKLEPHSPIPYIIRRAIELGALPFPELMKRLISDAAVLADMSRNLGIQELVEE